MAEPYINSVREHLTDAEDKIVFDRFHIMKHMGEAVDTVRKGEHRELRAEGIETLNGSKYLWLYAEKNLPDKHKSRFARPEEAQLADRPAPGPSRSRWRRCGTTTDSGWATPVLQAVVLLGDTLAPASRSSTSPT